jgi:16S rRNA (uracil1498-N3)-methyltransferase
VSGLRRLYAVALPPEGGAIDLPRESVEHLHVLRLHAGDDVELFDARGGAARARLSAVTRGRVQCSAEAPRVEPVPRVRLQLMVGVPKAAKLETIVRMLTELGVAGVHLMECERSVAKVSAGSLKLERLERIAREACAQSGQAYAPVIHAPRAFETCVRAAPADALKVAFWERATVPLSAACDAAAASSESWAVIGPEGGLSDAEAELLRECGFALVRLGRSILRVETACVVASSLLLARASQLE